MENSGMKANRKNPRSPRGSEKWPELLKHLKEDPSWKTTPEEVKCREFQTETLTFSVPYPQSTSWTRAIKTEVGLED